MRVQILFVIVAGLSLTGSAMAAPIMISQVPAYNWYHGCGPTAAASVLGYWDLHGYQNLFAASGWDNVKLTVNVQDQISSPQHIARYENTRPGHPDGSNDDLTQPTSTTSIADYFGTSVDSLQNGWSWDSGGVDAFVGYANHYGYIFQSWREYWGASGFVWDDLVAETNAGRPMMFLVDSDGDGSTDHFVPVFGYDDRGAGGLWYGSYNTWHENETVDWYQLHSMTNGDSWGVYEAWFVKPVSDPVPEPNTFFLFGTAALGLLGLVWSRRRRWK